MPSFLAASRACSVKTRELDSPIPHHTNRFEAGKEFSRELERVRYRQQRTDPYQVFRVIQWVLTVNTNPCAKRVGDDAKDVCDFAGLVRIGYGLRGRGAHRQYQVKLPVGDLPGDRVDRRQVPLGVVLFQDD